LEERAAEEASRKISRERSEIGPAETIQITKGNWQREEAQKRTRERPGKRKRCLSKIRDKKENLKEEVKKIYKRQRCRKETSSKRARGRLF
jgi:hypothetical protein